MGASWPPVPPACISAFERESTRGEAAEKAEHLKEEKAEHLKEERMESRHLAV
jgi:hypothetical protein